MPQVVAAFIRPHNGQRLRGVWNLIHHNLGRLVLLAAWAVIWLGVAWWQKDDGVRGGLARWVAPLAGVRRTSERTLSCEGPQAVYVYASCSA